MALMYPLGGPRFREGPKKVHSEVPSKRTNRKADEAMY